MMGQHLKYIYINTIFCLPARQTIAPAMLCSKKNKKPFFGEINIHLPAIFWCPPGVQALNPCPFDEVLWVPMGPQNPVRLSVCLCLGTAVCCLILSSPDRFKNANPWIPPKKLLCWSTLKATAGFSGFLLPQKVIWKPVKSRIVSANEFRMILDPLCHSSIMFHPVSCRKMPS